jgi:hypothetical protein
MQQEYGYLSIVFTLPDSSIDLYEDLVLLNNRVFDLSSDDCAFIVQTRGCYDMVVNNF